MVLAWFLSFSFFQASIRRGLGVCLGVDLGVRGVLISVLDLDLGLGLDTGLDVEIGAEGVVNIFSSCFLDIF